MSNDETVPDDLGALASDDLPDRNHRTSDLKSRLSWPPEDDEGWSAASVVAGSSSVSALSASSFAVVEASSLVTGSVSSGAALWAIESVSVTESDSASDCSRRLGSTLANTVTTCLQDFFRGWQLARTDGQQSVVDMSPRPRTIPVGWLRRVAFQQLSQSQALLGFETHKACCGLEYENAIAWRQQIAKLLFVEKRFQLRLDRQIEPPADAAIRSTAQRDPQRLGHGTDGEQPLRRAVARAVR